MAAYRPVPSVSSPTNTPELAPRLNALQAKSDRVSVEVIGRSTQGRELHLVTVTAPETNGQARRQEQLRQRIEQDPAAAAKDPALRYVRLQHGIDQSCSFG